LLSRINHFGFRYVDALSVNNEEQIGLANIHIRRYIPNAITDKKSEFSWENPFVLWVANIKDRKRPELFIELAKRFVENKVDFLMMGTIEENRYKWIAEHKLTPSNFYYLGPKPIAEVNGALSKSLFLVATSTPEGFSNNIIQAWQQKKPVVAYEFDPGGMIEAHGIGYVTSCDFELFVKKTHELITNTSLRKKLGDKASRFASEHFSTEKTIDKIESLIKEVID
jgi:glycosyltransferase involved in cell wall biosynthesis